MSFELSIKLVSTIDYITQIEAIAVNYKDNGENKEKTTMRKLLSLQLDQSKYY